MQCEYKNRLCKMIKKNGLPLLFALTVFVIWGHSFMPGSVSSNESGRVLNLLLPIWNGLGLGKLLPLDDHIVRKAFGHFLEYTVLGLELGGMVSLASLSGEMSRRDKLFIGSKHVARMACLGLLVAFFDESIQMISPDRGPAIADVWLDLGGVMTGMVIVIFVRLIRITKINKTYK